jgi:RES domain-containing protein
LIEAWRLCRRQHADLSGEGARIAGGRWNRRGRAVVYLAEHPALAVLEVRVHLDLPLDLLPDDYVLARVQLPDEPPGVPADTSDPLEAGEIWLRDRQTATLRVPSLLVPFACNLLLNPNHARASDASIVSLTAFRFDPRLWSTTTA